MPTLDFWQPNAKLVLQKSCKTSFALDCHEMFYQLQQLLLSSLKYSSNYLMIEVL
jgi:hypothetical protein